MANKKRDIKDTIFGAEQNSAAVIEPEKLQKYQTIAERMYHTPVLTARETFYPAIAHMGRKMSEQINSTYRTLFFVSVLRLDMLYVTLILTLIGIWDVLNNPLMGIVYDKTRTRWGKARPYAFFAPLFYFASTAVLFSGRLFFDNDITDDPGKILFVFIVLFVQETFATIYGIPTDNMPTLMSPNPTDRMKIGLWQTYFYKWGGDLVAILIMPLLDLTRSGLLPVSNGIIFSGFGIVTAIIGTAGSLFMSVGCKERVLLQPKPAPITKSMFYILKNKYMMRQFAASFASSWWDRGGYAWDVVSQLEIFGGVLRSFVFYLPRQIMQIVSLSFVEPFKRMFKGSYRKTVIFMRMCDFVSIFLPALLGMRFKIVNTWWKAGVVFALFDGLAVSNDAPSTVLEAELNREIGDYTEYMTGERPDGTIGLLTGLVMKVTAPLKALFTMVVFRWSGYNPSIGAGKWSQNVVRANSTMYSRVFALYVFGDFVPHIINTIPFFFYDLEGVKKEEVYRALNERRAMIAQENARTNETGALVEILSAEEANDSE